MGNGRFQIPIQQGGGDGRVGGQQAQHRRHVGVNHAHAFRHAADGDGFVVDLDRNGRFFFNRIRRHNGAGGGVAVGGGKMGDGGANARAHLVHRQLHANHPRRHDQNLRWIAANGGSRCRLRLTRIFHPNLACASVGVARIDDNGA